MTFDSSLTDRDLIADEQWRGLEELARFFAAETTPDEKVLDVTNQTARLFFANRRSVTRYFHLVYAALPDMQQEIVDRLEAEQTRFVLARPEGFDARFDGVLYRERFAIVAQYVTTRFSPFRTLGPVEVWRRNDALHEQD